MAAMTFFDGDTIGCRVSNCAQHRGMDHWHTARGTHSDGSSADAIRPLVVIDPEDRQQVERLESLYLRDEHDECANPTDCMADALREFANPTPPKPDEPLGLGAVVEDADDERWIKIDTHADCNDWTRIGNPENPDTAPYPNRRWTYNNIAAVKVLSEGVVSDG